MLSNVLDQSKQVDFCKGRSILNKEVSLLLSLEPLLLKLEGMVLCSKTLFMLGVLDLEAPRGLNSRSDVKEGISNLAMDY